MNTNKIEALESYYKTENDHWNAFAFDTVKEVLRSGLFEDPELPLQIIDSATNIFIEQAETPLAAFHSFTAEMEKVKLSASQKLLIVKFLFDYLDITEYKGVDLFPIKSFLKGLKGQLTIETKSLKPLTQDIRETLKEMVQNELATMQETIKGLDPAQRLNILCKLIPFVLPKVESIHHREGED